MRDKLNKIKTMSSEELENFSIKISLSNICDKTKDFLYKSIQERKKEIAKRQESIVENGELDDVS